MEAMKLNRFTKFAWFTLFYNLLVILWGAYVRASGSGAGCGAHWPLCNGVVIPRSPQIETLIEFTHRLMSGLSLIFVVILLVWALRSFPKGHPVRLGAWLSMVFIITEALVGAGLVLFEWVAHDDSVARALSMAVHLVNTFLLLAALTLTVWWGMGGPPIRIRNRGWLFWGLLTGLAGVLVLGVSGALNALGDTLFPAASLSEGIQQDFSPTAHFLIRLRVLHPSIAFITAVYLILFAGLSNFREVGPIPARFSRVLILLVIIQMGAGLLNVALLAPIWMQLIHLFLADAVWITLVFLAASTLSTIQTGAEVKHAAEAAPLSDTVS